MSNLFQKLFHPTHDSKDGLNQGQREAILDLLFYCMYADNNVASMEGKIISTAAEKFDWDPKVSYDSFVAQSISHARAVKESTPARSSFLTSVSERLQTSAARQRAVNLCKSLLESDGAMPSAEKVVLNEIQKHLSKAG